ncbi:MAG: 2OG-Fe(II) oxygenase [Bacteroidota bacterium]
MRLDETPFYAADQWKDWLNQLTEEDIMIVDDFMPDELYHRVQRYFLQLLDEHVFNKAAIGSNQQRQIRSSIRGDFIYWLDNNRDPDIADLFALFDEVASQLRQQLFLSLSDYEFHFALYPPKTRYEKHIDQFHGKKNRVVSMLIYLNEDWQVGDGGELKVYKSDGSKILIEPRAKRLVMFQSDSVPHEVLLTQTPRKSITGWLLHKPNTVEQFI